MTGLILALIYSGWKIMHDATIYSVFPTASHFLVNWFTFWAVVVGIVYLIALLLMTLGGASVGSQFGFLGGIIGMAGGGALGLLLMGLTYIAGWLFPLFGARLLESSLVEHSFDYTKLIFGFVLIIVGIIVTRRSSSSSSSSGSSGSTINLTLPRKSSGLFNNRSQVAIARPITTTARSVSHSNPTKRLMPVLCERCGAPNLVEDVNTAVCSHCSQSVLK